MLLACILVGEYLSEKGKEPKFSVRNRMSKPYCRANFTGKWQISADVQNGR